MHRIVDKKIAVIGAAGQVGGSIAYGLFGRSFFEENMMVHDVVPFAADHPLSGKFVPDLKTIVSDADILILAVPPQALEKLAQDIRVILGETKKPHKRKLMISATSVMGAAAHILGSAFDDCAVDYVVCHPVYGQVLGAEPAAPHIANIPVIVDTENKNADTLDIVHTLWGALGGAHPVALPAHHNDALYARTAHMTTLIAAAYAHTLTRQQLIEPATFYAGRAAACVGRALQMNADHSAANFAFNQVEIGHALDDFTAMLEQISNKMIEHYKAPEMLTNMEITTEHRTVPFSDRHIVLGAVGRSDYDFQGDDFDVWQTVCDRDSKRAYQFLFAGIAPVLIGSALALSILPQRSALINAHNDLRFSDLANENFVQMVAPAAAVSSAELAGYYACVAGAMPNPFARLASFCTALCKELQALKHIVAMPQHMARYLRDAKQCTKHFGDGAAPAAVAAAPPGPSF